MHLKTGLYKTHIVGHPQDIETYNNARTRRAVYRILGEFNGKKLMRP